MLGRQRYRCEFRSRREQKKRVPHTPHKKEYTDREHALCPVLSFLSEVLCREPTESNHTYLHSTGIHSEMTHAQAPEKSEISSHRCALSPGGLLGLYTHGMLMEDALRLRQWV